MPLYLIPGPEKIQWHRTLQSTHCALLTWFTLLTCGHGGWGGGGGPLWQRPIWGLKYPLESDCRTKVSRSIFSPRVLLNWLSHAFVPEYFQIGCCTRESRSIFNLTFARGCPGVFSNWLLHLDVKDYFQIDSRTRGSRSMIDTMERYWTLLNTIELYWTLLNTFEHYWTLWNTNEH